MKNFAKLHEIRLSGVKPLGWLRGFLEGEKTGMPGNLHRIGYPFDTGCWKYKSLADNGYEQWWPYEQSAYWIDSIVRTAALLDDEELYAIVGDQVEKALEFDDSFIGPQELKEHKNSNRWPMAVFFRALWARWSKTGDERILEKMRDHYLNDDADYGDSRDVVNVETMLRLYGHFGDERLLDKAKNAYRLFENSDEEYSNARSMTEEKVPYQHGVTYNEQAKLAAILYVYTGDDYYLNAAKNGYDKLEKYHMLPDGVHSSCEYTYGNDSKWSHESCDISDYTWSLGYMLEATGDAKYADAIEKACLNALPGAISPYFRQIQYFSQVNQPITARNSTDLESFANTPRMAYQPHHYPECCVGNIGRAMPNYILRMYQKTEEGMAVSLYGDSRFDDGDIGIEQSGGYPFGSNITLKITKRTPGEFVLKLRIPAWTKDFRIEQNGKAAQYECQNGYAALSVSDGDSIRLGLTMTFEEKQSADGGVYYMYGPFVLSLAIEEDWQIDHEEKRQTKDFPAYNVYPKSDWNYAAVSDPNPELVIHSVSENPFWDGVPFEIWIHARELPAWQLVKRQMEIPEDKSEPGIDEKQKECGATEVYEEQLLRPEIPDQEFIQNHVGDVKKIKLIPYGCTCLRITVFPKFE